MGNIRCASLPLEYVLMRLPETLDFLGTLSEHFLVVLLKAFVPLKIILGSIIGVESGRVGWILAVDSVAKIKVKVPKLGLDILQLLIRVEVHVAVMGHFRFELVNAPISDRLARHFINALLKDSTLQRQLVKHEAE